MTGRGRTDPDPAVKARAEALFQRKQEQKREGESAMGDYLAKEEAERTNMAKLREMRLAAEATASVKPEPKANEAATGRQRGNKSFGCRRGLALAHRPLITSGLKTQDAHRRRKQDWICTRSYQHS